VRRRPSLAVSPTKEVQPNGEVFDASTHEILKLPLERSSYSWEFIPVEDGTFRDSGTTETRSRWRARAQRAPAPR
jgi:hypothetical protein